MDLNDKKVILNKVVGCMKSLIDLDTDDSDTDNMLIVLTNICKNVTELPSQRRKRLWKKWWRNGKETQGSFAFLTKELFVNDRACYQNYVRMSKNQFDFLLNLVKDDIQRSNTQCRDAIPAEEKLALTLRFLATGECFKSLDYQTRVSQASISNMIPEVCNALYKHLKGRYFKFPSSCLKSESIAKEFAIKWQFPNCLGALDGKHITFRPLRRDGAFYHNYKGTNSIVLMALADANCKFIYVDIGCNGRSNDAGVFLQSSLRTILVEEVGLPKNAIVGNGRCLPYVIVADDAFPIQTHLLKPYPYRSNSNDKQMFNKRLSRARHVVEHAFGILSNRFRVLLAPMNVAKVATVQSIAFACCALHNFLLENDDTYINSVQDSSVDANSATSNSTNNARKGEAESIRQQFTEYFNNEGKLDWLNV